MHAGFVKTLFSRTRFRRVSAWIALIDRTSKYQTTATFDIDVSLWEKQLQGKLEALNKFVKFPMSLKAYGDEKKKYISSLVYVSVNKYQAPDS